MGKKFINPPLVEAVFEIKFKDPDIVDYDLFVGEIFSHLKKKYPISEPLAPKDFPSKLIPFVMKHRFRKIKDGYPLYQLGAGVMSFNMDGKTYNLPDKNCWNIYKKELLEFLKAFKYIIGEDALSEQNIEYVALRFINQIQDINMYPTIKTYFSNKLKLNIDLQFAENLDFVNDIEHNRITQIYNLDSTKKNNFQVDIATMRDNDRKLLVDLSVKTTNIQLFTTEIGLWLNKSHTYIEKYFLSLVSNITYLFEENE